MKKLFLVAAAGLAFVVGSISIAITTTPKSKFVEPRSAVHQMFISRDAEHAGCSGVMIAPTLMLTAYHCVAGGSARFVGPERLQATVLKFDEGGDVALLAVPMGCPCAPVASSPAAPDEPIIAIGYPMNQYVGVQMLTEGRAQGVAYHEELKGERLRLSVPVASGNSGGGVFAHRAGWKLVGILTNLTLKCDPFSPCLTFAHLSAASSLGSIHALLARPNDTPWAPKPAESELDV